MSFNLYIHLQPIMHLLTGLGTNVHVELVRRATYSVFIVACQSGRNIASLKEEGSSAVVWTTRLNIFLGLKIPFWLRVTIVRLESKGGSTLEAREKDYGKVGEEGGLDGTSGKSNRVEIGTESVGIVTGEEKLG